MLTFLLTSYRIYGKKAGYVRMYIASLHLTVFQDYTQLNETGYTYVDS